MATCRTNPLIVEAYIEWYWLIAFIALLIFAFLVLVIRK